MKIVFKIKEDDARNPGVIADCTGDNAGDSVGPTRRRLRDLRRHRRRAHLVHPPRGARPVVQVQLLVWIFVMRIVMVIASALSYFVNEAIAKARYGNADKMNFEHAAHVARVAHVDRQRRLHVRRLEGADPGPRRRRRCGGSSRSSSPAARSPARSSPSSSRCSPRPSRPTCARSSPLRARAALRSTSSPGLIAGNFSAFWMGIVVHRPHGHRVLREPDGASTTLMIGRARLRLRPRGLRLPRDGPGHDRGRLVRPGHRQRAVGLRALVHRDDPGHQGRDQEGLRLRRRLREGQALPRGERRRRQHLQGDGEAGAHRHGGRRRDDDDLLDHHAPHRRAHQRTSRSCRSSTRRSCSASSPAARSSTGSPARRCRR